MKVRSRRHWASSITAISVLSGPMPVPVTGELQPLVASRDGHVLATSPLATDPLEALRDALGPVGVTDEHHARSDIARPDAEVVLPAGTLGSLHRS
jgi:hypothetical protein